VYSADIYLEIHPEGVSKAAMISKMKEIHGGDHTVVALGDFYNDLEMLREADFGIAMGNAPDEVKAVADMVTLTNDEGGVSEVIESLLSGRLDIGKK
jgi:P-type E1-E2 ATPase